MTGKIHIPAGIDYVASDDQITALSDSGVGRSLVAPDGTIIIPRGPYGAQVAVSVNGSTKRFPTSVPISPTASEFEVIVGAGIRFLAGLGYELGGVIPTPTPTPSPAGVVLVGVNDGGGANGGPDAPAYTYGTQFDYGDVGDVPRLVAVGAKAVRWPYLMDRIIPIAGGPAYTDQLTAHRAQVQRGLDAGIESSTDDHSYGVYRNRRTRYQNAEIWCNDYETVHLPFKNHPLFKVEVGTNEPISSTITDNRMFQWKCVSILRARGWNNVFVFQGTADYSSAQNHVGRGDDQWMVNAVHWDEIAGRGRYKLRMACHDYIDDSGYAANSNIVPGAFVAKFSPLFKSGRANDYHVEVGETQIYDVPDSVAAAVEIGAFTSSYRRTVKALTLYAMTRFLPDGVPLSVINSSDLSIKQYPLKGLIAGFNAAANVVEAAIDVSFTRTPDPIPTPLPPLGMVGTAATEGQVFLSALTGDTTGSLIGVSSGDPGTIYQATNDRKATATYHLFAGVDHVSLVKMMGSQEVTSSADVTVSGVLVTPVLSPGVARVGVPYAPKLYNTHRGASAFAATASSGEAVTASRTDLSTTFGTTGTKTITLTETNAYCSPTSKASALPVIVLPNNPNRQISTLVGNGVAAPFWWEGELGPVTVQPGVLTVFLYGDASSNGYGIGMAQVSMNGDGSGKIDAYAVTTPEADRPQLRAYSFLIPVAGTYQLKVHDARGFPNFFFIRIPWFAINITHSGLPNRVALSEQQGAPKTKEGDGGKTLIGGAITVNGYVSGVMVAEDDYANPDKVQVATPIGVLQLDARVQEKFYAVNAEVAGNALLRPILNDTANGMSLLLDYPYA